MSENPFPIRLGDVSGEEKKNISGGKNPTKATRFPAGLAASASWRALCGTELRWALDRADGAGVSPRRLSSVCCLQELCWKACRRCWLSRDVRLAGGLAGNVESLNLLIRQ